MNIIVRNVGEAIVWLKSLVENAKQLSGANSFVVFGTALAGTRIGKLHLGKKVIALPEVPADPLVYKSYEKVDLT